LNQQKEAEAVQQAQNAIQQTMNTVQDIKASEAQAATNAAAAVNE